MCVSRIASLGRKGRSQRKTHHFLNLMMIMIVAVTKEKNNGCSQGAIIIISQIIKYSVRVSLTIFGSTSYTEFDLQQLVHNQHHLVYNSSRPSQVNG